MRDSLPNEFARPTPSADPGDDPTHISPEAPKRREARDHVALPVGTVLLEYAIEAVLGSGSSGITYLARDNNLQCRVAIKEYLPSDLAIRMEGNSVQPRTEFDTDSYRAGLDRFLVEARVLATFRHPNVVRVMRFFEANNTAYMVMDYENGESLRDWLASHGPVAEAEVLRMFLPLLDGLEVVHRSEVTHRDIKPANIYVRAGDGSLVLLDFGAARNAVGGASRSLTSMVTPGYAPFEQYHTHGKQGPWSDIYALGGVLYWLVTGEKPVEAPSRIKNDTMPPAAEAGAGRYSGHFLQAIDWALSIDEEQRPRDVGEFRAALTGERRPTQERGIAGEAPSKLGRKRGLALAGLATLALATVGGYFALWAGKTTVPGAEKTVAASAPGTEAAAVATHSQSSPKPELARAEKKAAPATPSAGPMATLTFVIRPEGAIGEVRIDGVKVGLAPPLKDFRISPGKHKIQVLRTEWIGAYQTSIELRANEKKTIWVMFPAS